MASRRDTGIRYAIVAKRIRDVGEELGIGGEKGGEKETKVEEE